MDSESEGRTVSVVFEGNALVLFLVNMWTKFFFYYQTNAEKRR